MENINFKGIPTSLFLNGPNLEIVSDPQNETDVVGFATFTGIATATFEQNPMANLDGGSIDFKWYYNGSQILDVLEDVTSGAGISTFDYVTGSGSTITITGKNSDLNGKEVYFTADYIPSAYQSESPVTAGTARSTANALNEPLQSAIATISVKPEIEITNQPNPDFVTLNAPATYNIEARVIPGNSPVGSYQWQLDENNLVDGTTETVVQVPSTGIITVVRPALPGEEADFQGLITKTIDLSEVASYDQFNPGHQAVLTTDRDITVRFHLEGAAGGSSSLWPNQGGGRGGLSVGTITLLQGETYLLNVGERGEDTNLHVGVIQDGSGGWPGGGDGGFAENGGGGGYTGLFLSSVSQENSLLIAGGGGGSSTGNEASFGGDGGGLIGENGAFWGNWGQMGLGGTQNPPVQATDPNAPGALASGAGGKLQGSSGAGGVGGGAGGGGYWGGGSGAMRDIWMSSAGGGGSGHINDSLVSDATTTQGEGSTGDGYVRLDVVSTPKTVTTTILGSETNNLSITTNHAAAGVIRCEVSADNVQKSPVFSRSVSYYTSGDTSIVNVETLTVTPWATTSPTTGLDDAGSTTAVLDSVYLNLREHIFEAVATDTEPDKLYSFYSPNGDLEVEMDLYGGMGTLGQVHNSFSTRPAAEGGFSRIRFTMKQNTEYILAGLTYNVNTPFLYEKSRLMAVVGEGGHSGGGNGGGIGVAGNSAPGFTAVSGNGGVNIETGNLTHFGTFGSAFDAGRLHAATATGNPRDDGGSGTDQDTQADGENGGQTVRCSKGHYWYWQGISHCGDLPATAESPGGGKFRLWDGSVVTNTTDTIQRGYKAGYNVMQTAGAGQPWVLGAQAGGRGGNGATGGQGGQLNNGGGGGSGYTDGSVEVVDTMLGGSTFEQARVVMRIVSAVIFTQTRSSNENIQVVMTLESGIGPQTVTFGSAPGFNGTLPSTVTADIQRGAIYVITSTTNVDSFSLSDNTLTVSDNDSIPGSLSITPNMGGWTQTTDGVTTLTRYQFL